MLREGGLIFACLTYGIESRNLVAIQSSLHLADGGANLFPAKKTHFSWQMRFDVVVEAENRWAWEKEWFCEEVDSPRFSCPDIPVLYFGADMICGKQAWNVGIAEVLQESQDVAIAEMKETISRDHKVGWRKVVRDDVQMHERDSVRSMLIIVSIYKSSNDVTSYVRNVCISNDMSHPMKITTRSIKYGRNVIGGEYVW